MRRGGTTVQNVEHTTLLLIKIEEERNLFVNTKIIAIIGRSGSGKSTLAKELAIDLNANIIKSFTTRDLRDEYDDHTQSTHQQYEIDKNNNHLYKWVRIDLICNHKPVNAGFFCTNF